MSELLRQGTAKTGAGFPNVRLRRLRRTLALRNMVRETTLSPSDFIYPLFVTHGRDVKVPIEPMPGQSQLSVDHLLQEVADASALGVGAVLLFGIPSHKDDLGTEAYETNGIVQEAVSAIKQAMPEMVVITDVCLCEYTDHGHCGVLLADGTIRATGAVMVTTGRIGV